MTETNRPGKWSFLHEYAVNLQQEAAKRGSSITIQSIADNAIIEYGLSLDREAARKIISRLLSADSTAAPETSFTEAYEQKAAPVRPTSLQLPDPGYYLILGCWHVPFNDPALTARILLLMEDVNFKGIILLGDFMDLNTLSAHDIGRFTAIPGLNLHKEYEAGKELIKQFSNRLSPNAVKVYLYGNHEDRWSRYMANMQNAKTPLQTIEEGIGLDQYNFQVIPHYKQGYIQLGDHLELIHGVYCSTHPAKKHMDTLRSSVVFAHTHRIQSHIEGHQGAFNIGWGGQVDHPAFNYADRTTRSQWQQGFATVLIDEKGDYFFQQIICQGSRFFFNQKLY